MAAFVGERQIVPIAEKVFPFAEGNAALEAMAGAEQFGKIVLVRYGWTEA